VVHFVYYSYTYYVYFTDPNMTTFLTPSPFHLLDHEYGMTPQNQIIPNPLTSPLTKSQVSFNVIHCIC